MKTRLKELFNLSLILCIPICSSSQQNDQIHKFLKSAFSSTTVKMQLQKSTQMANSNYNIPFIEKLELRSEANLPDIRKQDLVIRVSPNTRDSREAYKSYQESIQYFTEMEYESELMNALIIRYQIIADYVSTKDLLRVEKKKFEVAKDKVILLKRMVSLATFNIVDLIEAEDEIYQLQRKLRKLENSLQNLKNQLSNTLNVEEVQIFKNDILSVNDIERLLLEITSLDHTHPEIEGLSARYYNSILEHQWEEAQTKFSIGFLQMKYRNDPKENAFSNFTLGFGFDFPLKGASRISLNEKKLNILVSENLVLTKKESVALSISETLAQLKGLIDLYKLLQEQIDEGNADYSLNEYSKQTIASPIALIKLKELSIRNEALLIELEADVAATYLQYLYASGEICRKPYKNFLDPNLTTF